MSKAHYDITICTQAKCMCNKTKTCKRHISHYEGQEFIFQSFCMFMPGKSGCEYFKKFKAVNEIRENVT